MRIRSAAPAESRRDSLNTYQRAESASAAAIPAKINHCFGGNGRFAGPCADVCTRTVACTASGGCNSSAFAAIPSCTTAAARGGAARNIVASAAVSLAGFAPNSLSNRARNVSNTRSACGRSPASANACINSRTLASSSGASRHAVVAQRISAALSPCACARLASFVAACIALVLKRLRVLPTHCSKSAETSEIKTPPRNGP